MKKHSLRRLRAALLTSQAWAIHEPALAALYELLGPAAGIRQLSRGEINARVGIQAESESSVRMVGSIAVLPVVGVLQQRANWLTRALGWTATEQLERDFLAASQNDQVKGIVLYCDSPGGVAVGIEEVAATIFQNRSAKPLVSFVRGVCASACYYLASQTLRIVATPSSTVGSIGTIYTHIEFAEAYKELGYGVTVIKHGERKGDGNPYEKLSPAARASLQRWVTSYGEQFDAAVARGRGVSVADVRARFGQGEAYLAAEAKNRGLVDQVGTWEQVVAGLPTSAVQTLPEPRQIADLRLPTSAFDLSIASALPAGVFSAGPVIPSSPAAPNSGPSAPEQESVMKVSARVRGALLARGLITAMEAADETCLAALNAFFAARGEAAPLDSDDKLVGALMTSPVAAIAAAAAPLNTVATPAPSPSAAAPNVQQAHDREMQEARQQGATSERDRQIKIRASGTLLQMSAEAIEAAITAGQPHEQVIAGWHDEIAKREKPVQQQAGGARVTGEGSERFATDACLAMLARIDRVPAAEASQVTDQVRQLSSAPLAYFARQCLEMSGVRLPQFLPNEELFEIAFAMDGEHRITVGANYSPYNRPGSFPNILSNLANKIMDAALELAGTSYEDWTGMWPGDLPDFKPAPIVNKSQHDEMDEILDAEASKEFGLSEELLSYMVLRRFSNMFALTPVMAAADDLGAFDEGLLGLESAWQNTVNRLCLNLLTGNVALLDSYALFDNTNHGNDITTGGAPDATQWEAMELKVAAQRGVGGTGYIRSPLGVALVPPKHYIKAQQLFAPLQVLGEMKVPTSDTGINPYRGTVKVVREPELQAFSSDVWYGLCRPRGLVNATVVRAYFRGWGKNGRRQRWFDPKTKCWNFELEGRVGGAAKQYRTAVRNDGTA